MAYDVVVIGAGSAGSVLASRLTEDPSCSVCVLEAGRVAVDAEADRLANITFAMTMRDWGFQADAGGGRVLPYPQGKAAGGGSAVNGGVALRGVPADYDGWAALGNPSWSWEQLLPSFVRLEDDRNAGRDAGDEVHGHGGPIPIVRWQPDELVPQQQAFRGACQELGMAWSDDLNHPLSTGVGSWPMNRVDGVRFSTALGYLEPARHRPNLTVEGDAHVVRVVFDGTRALGVEVERDGRVERIDAGEVLLCAGAVNSAAVLWRSGVGPAAQLAALGIPVVVDRPVGSNLMEHVGSFLFVLPEPDVCDPSEVQFQLGARYTARGSSDWNDMQLSMMNYWDLDATPELEAAVGASMIFSVTCGVQTPRARGRVWLTSADHRVAPSIDLNLLGDAHDVELLVEGLRTCRAVLGTEAMRSRWRGIAMLSEADFDDDEALARYARATSVPWYHPSGTARMGPSSDDGAVVDDQLRVHGVEGLRVVDASVIPVIPRANTNLTCIAIGERASDLIRRA